jgi:ADP-ribose pyrophosphatase
VTPADEAEGDRGAVVWEGKYVKVTKQGTWEYVSRTRNVTAAVILALHDGEVILVEQYRVPLGATCLELPAGLVGDEQEGEAIETAAIRELEEETGYRAERMIDLGRFYASPGMSSEGFNLLRAEGLTRVGEGGGTEHEQIVVHHVPVDAVPAFITVKRAEGVRMDVKLLLLLASDLLK